MSFKNQMQDRVNEYAGNLKKLSTKELLIHLCVENFIQNGFRDGQLKRSKR